MGIWRVLTGKVICDNCEKLLAHIEFDADDEPTIERVHALCVDCKKLKDEGRDALEKQG